MQEMQEVLSKWQHVYTLDAASRKELFRQTMDSVKPPASGEGDHEAVAAWEWRNSIMDTIICPLSEEILRSFNSSRVKRFGGMFEKRLSPLFTTLGGVGAASAAVGGVIAGKGTSGLASWAPAGLIAFGLLAGALGGVLSTNSYAKNDAKSRRYKRLWWDMWNYAILVLPTADKADVYKELSNFTMLREQAGM